MKPSKIVCFVIMGLFVLGCAAIAEKTKINNMTDEEVAAYNEDPNNTDKIVCRTEKPIGSNIPRRTCQTQSHLDDRTAQDRRAMDEFQRNSSWQPAGK